MLLLGKNEWHCSDLCNTTLSECRNVLHAVQNMNFYARVSMQAERRSSSNLRLLPDPVYESTPRLAFVKSRSETTASPLESIVWQRSRNKTSFNTNIVEIIITRSVHRIRDPYKKIASPIADASKIMEQVHFARKSLCETQTWDLW